MALLHATVVAFGERAVLLRGPPGAGKSDLALRLIGDGAVLVADDQVELEARGQVVYASPPAAIAGRMEVRGVGIIAMPYRASATVTLVVDLVAPDRVDRLPERATAVIAGLPIALFALNPFEASTPLKIRAILGVLG